MNRRNLYILVGGVAAIAVIWILLEVGAEESVVVDSSPTGTITNNARFWWLFSLGTIVLLGWAVINATACPNGTPLAQRLRGCPPPAWAFVILLGVTTFHWLFWAIGPGAWSAWLRSELFWPMNAAIVLAAFLASQQGGPARWAGFTLAGLIFVAIGIGTYGYFFQSSNESRTVVSATTLPADTVLPIIAQCESGGRQFDDDGDVIMNSSSSAVGKYQILERTHSVRAKNLGLDLRTEKGNERFARLLYSEEGLAPWEASRDCWEPRLAVLGYSPSTTSTSQLVRLTLRPDEPGMISVPPGWRWDIQNLENLDSWSTDQGFRDARGNRVQIFEVVPPAEEVQLEIKIRKCLTTQDCAW